jgi:hypothetical protein
MRTAAKRDENEAAIIQALRKIGVTVYRMSGPGLPDTLCHDMRGRATWNGKIHYWLPIEIKMPGKTLTKAQRDTQLQSPFPIVTSRDEALDLFLGRIHL